MLVNHRLPGIRRVMTRLFAMIDDYSKMLTDRAVLLHIPYIKMFLFFCKYRCAKVMAYGANRFCHMLFSNLKKLAPYLLCRVGCWGWRRRTLAARRAAARRAAVLRRRAAGRPSARATGRRLPGHAPEVARGARLRQTRARACRL